MQKTVTTSTLNLFFQPINKHIHLLTFQKCNSRPSIELRNSFPSNTEFFTSFRFVDDLLSAIADDSLNSLRKYFRETEILVIEDLKDLKNKSATQIFLREILESRKINSKKTIIFSEKQLRKQSYLTKRLKKTIQSGLVVQYGY